MIENELQPKVSVIVPMYNCAQFLPDFFLDMQNQHLRNFELICVIDGATDDTLDVVKRYATEDNRIRYFCKDNGGAGSARNYGLHYACGEYVMWIDADDRYSPDLLVEMVSAADKFNANEVLCLFESYDYKTDRMLPIQGFRRKIFPENTCVDPSEALINNTFAIAGSGPTNKLYRRTFVVNNNLSYSTTRASNDTKFISAAISIAKRVVGVHKILIHVKKCINPDSITSNRGKYIQEIPTVYSELYQWLKERNLHERYHNTFCRNFKDGISYNSQFGLNMEFIEAVVYSLNEREPWVNMSSDEIAKIFNKWFNIEKGKNELKKLETSIRENNVEDRGGMINLLNMEKSRLESMALIKMLSNVRYNRNFDDYRIVQLKKKLLNAQNQLKREKSSWNYRIGSAITWLPKKIYYLCK